MEYYVCLLKLCGVPNDLYVSLFFFSIGNQARVLCPLDKPSNTEIYSKYPKWLYI